MKALFAASLLLLVLGVEPASARQSEATSAQRAQWLEMFARGYFPGRSGQIFVIPREGDIITSPEPLYRYMHGSPWDYDARIPLLFHGAPFIRQGSFTGPARQQDIAPTLGALVGVAPAPTMTGRPLTAALAPGAGRPRVIALFVFDGMRAELFDRFAAAMPTITRLRREGAWFANARVDYLPTVTSTGHATIGTGTDPRLHGLAANNLFNRVTGKPQEAYAGLDPGELMALTLADLWNLRTDGRAVIAGQGGAIRAAAGLVGRGACLINARPVVLASYSSRDAGWETNPACYRMPDYLTALNGKPRWEAAGGRWMGHDVANPTRFRASALFQQLEGDAVKMVVEHEPFGEDEITDLLLVSMKTPDYVGHQHGPESTEMEAALAELDRQMTAILGALEKKAGPNGTVVAITADHGMPSEPAPGRRHFGDDIVKAIHQRFDPEGAKVVQYFSRDTANGQVYVDTARLQSLGHTLKDVAAMVEGMDAFVAAFTEDEVRAAAAKLSK